MAQYLAKSFFSHLNPSEALEKKELALIIAQTAWGEDIIRPILKKLMTFCECPDVNARLLRQLNDEHRHNKLYWQHIWSLDASLNRRLSPIYQRIACEALVSEDPFELLASILICLEPFAMGAFKFRRDTCTHAQTLQLDQEIETDEILHIETGFEVLRHLRQAGHPFDRNKVSTKVRRIITCYQSESFVEPLRSEIGEDIVASIEKERQMEAYYRVCGDEYMGRFQEFMRIARPEPRGIARQFASETAP